MYKKIMAPSQDKWIRRFVITETSRHKRGFTIYKVTSLVFLKNAPEIVSKISVWKRYNDFKKLHKTLHAVYKNSKIEEPFPAFAKPKIFGRFEGEVVNERRECAIRLFKFIADYSLLYTNESFVKFFESSILNDSADCSVSMSSDTSEDDHMKNLEGQTIANVRSIDNFPSTSKILMNSRNIYHNTERTIYNTSDLRSSECSKANTGHVQLNFNVESSQLNDRESIQRAISIPSDSELIRSLDDANDRYVIVAAAHMSAGYQHEALGEYEEAYVQYKLGIAHLRHGVELDSDHIRQAKICEKIRKYSDRADILYSMYLNRNMTMLCRPVTELENYKVLRLMGSVLLVKDTRENVERVIKTVEKRGGDRDDINHYILQQRVPFMVHLHAFIETETTVFLILDYIKGGKLWNYLNNHYGVAKEVNKLKSSHERSASCNAIVQIDKMEAKNGEMTSMELEKMRESFLTNKEVPINQLLENSQKLLRSVDATLRKSNSVASKLNEFTNLLYEPMERKLSRKNSDSGRMNEEVKSSLSSPGNLSFEHIDISEISHMSDLCQPLALKLDEDTSESPRREFVTSSRELAANGEVDLEQGCWTVPETSVKRWAAQIILALESLHEQNVVVSALTPDDILMNSSSDIALCYIVPRQSNELLNFQVPYTAPELCMYLPPMSTDPAADVWSFGVILYELLTGISFQSRHHGLFHSHSAINIPTGLSSSAKGLLLDVLKFDFSARLTIPQIKKHPFFDGIEWTTL